MRSLIPLAATLALLAGCATVPLQRGGTLSSYAKLRHDSSLTTDANIFVDRDALRTVRTVRIVPTAVSPALEPLGVDASQVRMVQNAIDRSLCTWLGESLRVVGPGDAADVTVRPAITAIVPTDPTMSGISTAASLGASAVSVPVPRIPLGLGGLSAEVEAVDGSGRQVAALVWARGANAVTERARASNVGDAYELAFKFAGDFTRMVSRGATPFGGIPSLPSVERVRTNLGGASPHVACRAYGRAPGVVGIVGSRLGLPPDWTDRR